MKNPKTGLGRIYNAILYSKKGLQATWKNEAAFRQELMVCAATVVSMPFIVDNYIEFLFLWVAIAMVLVTELVNSAIESIVDRVGEEYHELAGRSKDQASAAVFISMLLAITVWITVAIF